MHRNTKKFILKIFVLSTMIIFILNIWDYYLKASSKVTIAQVSGENKQNKQTFKKANYSWLWNTSVAITTNLWISYTQIKQLPATIYQEIFSISELIEDKNAQSELIWNNMVIINEYLNVLKTDVKQLINTKLDKLALLNAFVDQLQYRYNSWIKSQEILVEQKNIFITNITNSDNWIEILKTKMAEDFKNSDSEASLENINNYLELKKENNNARVYISYIDKFLIQFNFLNNYAKNLATVIINNKEAIIKDAYLVIPKEWWIQSLADFKLIFNEWEVK